MNKCKLEKLIKQRKEFILVNDNKEYKRCRVQVDRKGVVLRDIIKGQELKTKKQQLCKKGDFIVAEIDAKVGGYGFIPEGLEGTIVSSHYFLFELDESKLLQGFLEILLQTDILQNQINPQGSTNYSSIRPNAILQIEIPLPDIQVQQNFIKEYSNLKEKLLQIQKFNDDTIESLKSNITTSLLFKDFKSIDLLREYIIEKNERINNIDSNIPKVGVSNMMGIVPLKITKKTDFKNYKVVKKGDFVYNPMRVDVGSIGLYEEDIPAITSPDYVVFSVKDQQILSPHVLLKYLKSKRGLSQIGINTVGSVRKRLYFSNLCKIEIPKIDTTKNKKIDNIVRKINIVLEILEMNKVDILNLNSALLYKMLVIKEFI